MKPEAAQRSINAFAKRFGAAHLDFARHAALPLALTPDLLYRLWANFRRDSQGNLLNIPWISVSDLILSSLCDEVGYELFEMDPVVRQELLKQLKEDPRFGEQRLREVAGFLLKYVEQDLSSVDEYDRDFAESQSWAALAYKNPQASVKQLAAAFDRAYRENPADLMRLATLTEMISQPIPEFERLLIFARSMGHYSRNRLEEAKSQILQLQIQGNSLSIGGVNLQIPAELLDHIEEMTKAEPKKSIYENIPELIQTSDTLTIVPTLIIGVGGTGLEVITRIRRLIVESYGSLENLEVVSFLHIDTDQNYRIKKLEMSGLPLEDSEKFWSKVSYHEAERIKDYPENYSWYHNWLPPELSPQQLVSEEGAGQIRACGRFSFFYNHEQIRAKCQEARRKISEGRDQITIDDNILIVEPKLNIFVVGSISGGTGSGMLIDLGYSLRKWFQGENLEIAAIIPTPDAFSGIGGNLQTQENGYAALMELNYFSDLRTIYNVSYGISESTRIIDNRPPYDFIYLTSDSNQSVTLGINAIREIIAQQIVLDLVSGYSVRKRSVRDNMKRLIGTSIDQPRDRDGQPTGRSYPANFFSFGIATIEIPVHAIRQALATRLTADLYKWWLNANVQLPSDLQPEVDAELQELKLFNKKLLNEILLNTEGKHYEVVIERWIKELESKIIAENRLACTAKAPNLFAKETGKILEFVDRYLKPVVDEYNLEHLHDNYRKKGDFLQRMHDNAEKLSTDVALIFQEIIYTYLEDTNRGSIAIKALLKRMRVTLENQIEKLEREAEKTWRVLEKVGLEEYNQACSQISEFRDRWMVTKENKMKEWCDQALAGFERSCTANLQRQSRLIAANVQHRFLEVIKQTEIEIDRWSGQIQGSESKYRELIIQTENYIDQLELVGLKLFERQELLELYRDFLAISGGQDVLFKELTQQVKKTSNKSKFWSQSSYAQQEFRLLDAAKIDYLKYPQFEEVVAKLTQRKIREASTNSKLYTEMDACTRFMRLYPEIQDQDREIRRLFNLSKPLIRLDTTIPQDVGFRYIEVSQAGIVGGENTSENAAQQQVPLLKKYFTNKDAIAPLSNRERYKILATHEVAGFSLRCIIGTENLRSAYQTWRASRIQAERAILKGLQTVDSLPSPVHIQKDMVFWDFHPADPAIQKLILVARAFGILRQEVNQATRKEVILYTILTPSHQEDMVMIGANWEDAIQVLELPDCRKDKDEVERQLNELLKNAGTESQKQQLGKKLQDFLAERLKTEFSNNDDQPMYRREKTIILDFIIKHKLGTIASSSASPKVPTQPQSTTLGFNIAPDDETPQMVIDTFGQELLKHCSNCGNSLSPNNRFCSSCGTPVS